MPARNARKRLDLARRGESETLLPSVTELLVRGGSKTFLGFGARRSVRGSL